MVRSGASVHHTLSSPRITVRAAGCVRVNSASIWLCSQAVAAFIARLANRPPSSRSSTSGRSRREEEEPTTAESNAAALAKAGMENRALVEIGTRGSGGDSGSMPHGSITATNR